MKAVNVKIIDGESHRVRSKLLTVQDNMSEEDIIKTAYKSFHYEGYSGYTVYTNNKTIWDTIEWKRYDYILEYAKISNEKIVVVCSECGNTIEAEPDEGKINIKPCVVCMDVQKTVLLNTIQVADGDIRIDNSIKFGVTIRRFHNDVVGHLKTATGEYYSFDYDLDGTVSFHNFDYEVPKGYNEADFFMEVNVQIIKFINKRMKLR